MNNSSFYDWFQPRYPSTFPAKKSHIVSIPVQFLRSESTRSESALKIQKLFRGFMARRIVKQLIALKREVDEIEAKISNSVEILRIDSKERLILNERLMSLLLKLDSVVGVLPGVRDCRKAVIKKAIALQERIDAIVVTKTVEIKPDVCNCEVEEKSRGENSEEMKENRNMVALMENEKMVEKLMENNEVQMKMIRLLTKRVEQLERALLCEKKKKNKQKKMISHFVM